MAIKVPIPPALAAVAGGRELLSTKEAAPQVNRTTHTLYKWSLNENGPIKPVRILGRLGWRVTDLAALLNGEVPE
ncbi:DNA-binding protein [Silvimonas iriomotensis]|uniref:DNA-binding protein n=1 Tax=Silvimonas iriomotensis TaxID=449662 RepID=A0ABQ2PCR6_9NEIS|nr:DNA-binding protein [Silvimonas iriomotensis]GGP23026.1 hypothetical protein GCM10010970_30260 [Silvimonas iriomotensis]